MSALIGVFLKVDKLEELISDSKRNGYSGIFLDISINDNLDNYGNNGQVMKSQTKSERDAAKPKEYVGTAKVNYVSKEGVQTTKNLSAK